ncbi:MAG: hypothetical protein C4548_14270 [Desulfobacteraceae bacterium]|nr:MAG: hypothetical protein C4548_14270 [Desulfobacteraceae bacterium]
MRVTGLMMVCLICFMPVLLSAASLEPMSDAAMDGIVGQYGIAVGLDNVQIYSHGGWAYEATDGDGSRKIEFNDTASYLILDTNHPLAVQVFQNPDGVSMLGIIALSPDDDPALEVFLLINTEDLVFCDEAMGSLHLRGLPRGPDNPVGFMEEFALLLAPRGAQGVFEGDGMAFQLEFKSGIDELSWDYNKSADDQLRFGGVYMVGQFDDVDYTNPANWDPQGRFAVGNLNPNGDGSDITAATFHVAQDTEGAFVRLNLPMQGSIRMEEIEMYTDADNLGIYSPADFGPIIIDGMTAHHFQVDFRP